MVKACNMYVLFCPLDWIFSAALHTHHTLWTPKGRVPKDPKERLTECGGLRNRFVRGEDHRPSNYSAFSLDPNLVAMASRLEALASHLLAMASHLFQNPKV